MRREAHMHMHVGGVWGQEAKSRFPFAVRQLQELNASTSAFLVERGNAAHVRYVLQLDARCVFFVSL